MRGESRTLPNGARVIDECYNSNPQAMEEVLAWFSGLTTPGRRIVASGDMLELGMQERRAHQALGERIAEVAPDLFIGVGPLHREAIEAARAAGLADSRHFASASAAGDFLAGWIRDGDLLLVKGSRGLQMEIIIQRLERKGRSGG
jgi:UDP-N-acetylmuramoyl-tripeptide--D-alanyl-D-alanine ligase